MDELLTPKEQIPDQWKKYTGKKKRIIYAPHHSIDPENTWQTSTFLMFGEAILQLAEKYSDQVQWAFKPHPLLREKVEKIWGKEKTDAYYGRWNNVSWGQFEPGKYMGLFHHSDAMIHDCGSFIMEYLYTNNPVLYIMRNKNLADTFNSAYKKALSLHYQAWTLQEIEEFILNVINGKDLMKQKRDYFKESYLVPPNGKSASDNIIDCLLYGDKANKMLVNTKNNLQYVQKYIQ